MFFCQVAEKMPKYRQHKLGICYEVYEQMYNLHLHIFWSRVNDRRLSHYSFFLQKCVIIRHIWNTP